MTKQELKALNYLLNQGKQPINSHLKNDTIVRAACFNDGLRYAKHILEAFQKGEFDNVLEDIDGNSND